MVWYGAAVDLVGIEIHPRSLGDVSLGVAVAAVGLGALAERPAVARLVEHALHPAAAVKSRLVITWRGSLAAACSRCLQVLLSERSGAQSGRISVKQLLLELMVDCLCLAESMVVIGAVRGRAASGGLHHVDLSL